MTPFVKRNPHAPQGFFAWEAAGLRWLSDVPGGVPCARVIDVDDTGLSLQRLTAAAPTEAAALRFGQGLAVTHGAGAGGFGSPPAGWTGPGFFGPLHRPLPMSLRPHARWGEFYAEERLAPMLGRASDALDPDAVRIIGSIIGRCRAGEFDDDDRPVRLHGDLWSGNVMWTPDGVVLIDPAAHGGHRETDLAMLALFGCPHLQSIYRGYRSVYPLKPNWSERIALHQLYPLLAHVALFGAGYVGQTVAAARRALALR